MLKNWSSWLVIGLVLMTVFNQFSTRQDTRAIPMEYSEFMEAAKQGQISKVEIQGRTIRATTQEKKQIVVNSPGLYDIWMVGDLMKYGVKVSTKPEEEQSMLMQIFISWFPMLLLIGVWIFFMRQIRRQARRRSASARRARACSTNPQHA
jgi:cell division protease FtsH